MRCARSRLFVLALVVLFGACPVTVQAQNANLFDVLRSLFGGAPPAPPQPEKPKKPHKPRVAMPVKPGSGNLAYGPPMPPQFLSMCWVIRSG